MKPSFPELLANNENTYYPLRLMASDFFIQYWKIFIPEIPNQYVPIIQKAARDCVDYFMNGEEIYWNISFEKKIALNTWQLFDRLIQSLPLNILASVHTLAILISVSPEESDSSDYLLNLLTRLRFDAEFRKLLDYSDRDVAVLNAVYEYNCENLINLGELKEGWLASQTEWDVKLKLQTPDLLESVYVIFSFAYNPKSNLPIIHENLHNILDKTEEYQSFVYRLESAFNKSIENNMEISFPRLLQI